ncbi:MULTISPECIES: DUF802 domain-containing protein [unclassified Caballeronia]|uniref:DUF802 domain-containing protein n=1 Tax=unclassified Caballeronia TaxID=2646786 RepID=UPI00285FE844|nr:MULTISPECIES: DUF802 domain-containing protein [unclassified Caballeronia]MDR5774616.1 DUF802 domain-containing protein [Caballeronia sp. LZ002]MDR5850052.1 DUF802 domain-containing protein [Caballeronia sp. LZ003]
MPRYILNVAVFLAGLAAVCGIAIGYVGSNALAFCVTLLIGACYLAGAAELQRYQQTTYAFAHALRQLAVTPKSLAVWLESLPVVLRNAVRLRVEGERAALPAPVLAPYLVGLLVLLGMLGTLLGMVVTLRGTGAALESATDLSAIRSSLAAPVTGLSFAFGTSIAGVATSAMLGLLSALCRRERLDAVQTLDLKIATTLRVFTETHRREEGLKLMQRQAELMPKLVDRLQAMMHAIEQQSIAANERQLTNQDAFHAKTETSYRRLAASVEQSLKQSVADSARAASSALQPIMQSAMDGIAGETAALHGKIEQAVARQLDGLSSGFEASSAKIAGIWQDSLDKHRQSNEALVTRMGTSLDGFAQGFETRSAALLEGVSARMERITSGFTTSVTEIAEHWNQSLAGHRKSNEALMTGTRAALDGLAETFEQRASGLIDGVAARLDHTSSTLAETWSEALTQQTRTGEHLAAQHEQALLNATASFQEHAASLLLAVDRSHAGLRDEIASNSEARLNAWTDALATLAANQREQWQETSAFAAERQQNICDTLARTASEMAADAEKRASGTIAKIEGLVAAASEAPKLAADVIAQMREKLSESMVHDNAMLDERTRLLATLETLLDAVNHTSNEQRVAVDALVASSSDLLARVGTQFTDKVEAETLKLETVAAQVTSGALEVASLGDALGGAVQSFGASNELLVAHLKSIEAALDKSLARSDEQLAYYVAQAREVIDLSTLSQKQIVEDLQRIAGQRAAGAKAA